MFGIDLTWIVAGLGGLGIAGFIALLVFAPAAAAIVGNFIVKVASSLPGMIAIALIGGFVAGDIYRATFDRTACDARVQALNADWQKKTDKLQADWRASIDKAATAFTQAKQALDAKVKAELEAAKAKRDAEMQQAEQQWQQQFESYKKTIKADPNCTVQPEDIR